MIDGIGATLFDLDGTLIDINLKKFIPAYVKLLSEYVSDYVPAKKLIPKLMKASEIVEANNGKDTNENVYASFFFPLEGYEREELEPVFEEFYEQEFHKLKKYISEKPYARKCIEKAFEKGYKVVIATTPLLPLTAIQQRLEWGNVGDFDYDLITSYENISATKPNLLYFELIAEKIEVSVDKCLMVGDESKDLVVKKLGAKTFLIKSENTEIESDIPEPDYVGKLEDLYNML